MHDCACLTPAYTCTQPCTPSAHLHTHLYTSSHIPTQGLNLKLINRMKLDQTEKRGKKEEDRKKKEQESAEGISGLKSRYRKKAPKSPENSWLDGRCLKLGLRFNKNWGQN